MKRTLIAVLACVALLGPAVGAQDRANFAGTWKLADPATPQAFTPTVMNVVQDASSITVTTTSQMGEFKTSYKLDGSEGRSPLDFNGTTIDRMTKVIWEGNKLWLITASEADGRLIEFKSAWSLTADGALLTESTIPDFQNGGAPITTKATYKK